MRTEENPIEIYKQLNIENFSDAKKIDWMGENNKFRVDEYTFLRRMEGGEIVRAESFYLWKHFLFRLFLWLFGKHQQQRQPSPIQFISANRYTFNSTSLLSDASYNARKIDKTSHKSHWLCSCWRGKECSLYITKIDFNKFDEIETLSVEDLARLKEFKGRILTAKFPLE